MSELLKQIRLFMRLVEVLQDLLRCITYLIFQVIARTRAVNECSMALLLKKQLRTVLLIVLAPWRLHFSSGPPCTFPLFDLRTYLAKPLVTHQDIVSLLVLIREVVGQTSQ